MSGSSGTRVLPLAIDRPSGRGEELPVECLDRVWPVLFADHEGDVDLRGALRDHLNVDVAHRVEQAGRQAPGASEVDSDDRHDGAPVEHGYGAEGLEIPQQAGPLGGAVDN